MNIHTPSSEMSRAELEILSQTANNMIGTQASKPLLTVVQDCLLGAYLMTSNNDEIPKDDFEQMCMSIRGFDFNFFSKKMKMIEQVYQEFNPSLPLYCGKSLFSLLLPSDFNYTVENKAMSTEPVVQIYKGVLYSGAINKKNIGGQIQALTNYLHKEYSNEMAMLFIDNIQFLAIEYNMYYGFSIGISDCLVTKKQEIKEQVFRCFAEASHIEESVSNPIIREVKISMALNKAKDIGMRLAKEALKSDNSFLKTVYSGSKGDFFNICQITGLLGQQNITGKRIQPQFNQGRRTLPHYKLDEKLNQDKEYESKGFIRHSFMRGLTPQEFWFHAMSGREGITDREVSVTTGCLARSILSC